MFSFIDPGLFPRTSLGPGLSNNFCDWHDVEQSQAVWRGFPHKKKNKNHVWCPFIESSVKKINLNRDIAAQTGIPALNSVMYSECWKAEAGLSSLAGDSLELMDPGRQRCSASSWARRRPRLRQQQTGGTEGKGSVWGTESGEGQQERKKTERAWSHCCEVTAGERLQESLPLCKKKETREKLELLLVQKSAFPLYNQINYRNFWKQ